MICIYILCIHIYIYGQPPSRSTYLIFPWYLQELKTYIYICIYELYDMEGLIKSTLLKTNIAPENRPFATKRKGSSPNHQLSGAILVSGYSSSFLLNKIKTTKNIRNDLFGWGRLHRLLWGLQLDPRKKRSGQITKNSKPELRGFWEDSPTKPHFGVTNRRFWSLKFAERKMILPVLGNQVCLQWVRRFSGGSHA